LAERILDCELVNESARLDRILCRNYYKILLET